MHFSLPIALIVILAALLLVSGIANYVAIRLLRRQQTLPAFPDERAFAEAQETGYNADVRRDEVHDYGTPPRSLTHPRQVSGWPMQRLQQGSCFYLPRPRDLGFTERYTDGLN